MKLFFKLLLGAAIACVLLFIGWSLLLASAFGAFDKQYSRQEILDNYQSKASEITSLIAYYNSIVPTGKEVDVEFEDDDIRMISIE
jgi:Tfp pilus assembly protein PilO